MSRVEIFAASDIRLDLEAVNSDGLGLTPLLCAANVNNHQLVTTLLGVGADIEAKDPYGRTALIVAAANGYEEFVSALLAKGASVRSIDAAGNTALSLASKNKYEKVVKLLEEAIRPTAMDMLQPLIGKESKNTLSLDDIEAFFIEHCNPEVTRVPDNKSELLRELWGYFKENFGEDERSEFLVATLDAVCERCSTLMTDSVGTFVDCSSLNKLARPNAGVNVDVRKTIFAHIKRVNSHINDRFPIDDLSEYFPVFVVSSGLFLFYFFERLASGSIDSSKVIKGLEDFMVQQITKLKEHVQFNAISIELMVNIIHRSGDPRLLDSVIDFFNKNFDEETFKRLYHYLAIACFIAQSKELLFGVLFVRFPHFVSSFKRKIQFSFLKTELSHMIVFLERSGSAKAKKNYLNFLVEIILHGAAGDEELEMAARSDIVSCLTCVMYDLTENEADIERENIVEFFASIAKEKNIIEFFASIAKENNIEFIAGGPSKVSSDPRPPVPTFKSSIKQFFSTRCAVSKSSSEEITFTESDRQRIILNFVKSLLSSPNYTVVQLIDKETYDELEFSNKGHKDFFTSLIKLFDQFIRDRRKQEHIDIVAENIVHYINSTESHEELKQHVLCSIFSIDSNWAKFRIMKKLDDEGVFTLNAILTEAAQNDSSFFEYVFSDSALSRLPENFKKKPVLEELLEELRDMISGSEKPLEIVQGAIDKIKILEEALEEAKHSANAAAVGAAFAAEKFAAFADMQIEAAKEIKNQLDQAAAAAADTAVMAAAGAAAAAKGFAREAEKQPEVAKGIKEQHGAEAAAAKTAEAAQAEEKVFEADAKVVVAVLAKNPDLHALANCITQVYVARRVDSPSKLTDKLTDFLGKCSTFNENYHKILIYSKAKTKDPRLKKHCLIINQSLQVEIKESLDNLKDNLIGNIFDVRTLIESNPVLSLVSSCWKEMASSNGDSNLSAKFEKLKEILKIYINPEGALSAEETNKVADAFLWLIVTLDPPSINIISGNKTKVVSEADSSDEHKLYMFLSKITESSKPIQENAAACFATLEGMGSSGWDKLNSVRDKVPEDRGKRTNTMKIICRVCNQHEKKQLEDAAKQGRGQEQQDRSNEAAAGGGPSSGPSPESPHELPSNSDGSETGGSSPEHPPESPSDLTSPSGSSGSDAGGGGSLSVTNFRGSCFPGYGASKQDYSEFSKADHCKKLRGQIPAEVLEKFLNVNGSREEAFENYIYIVALLLPRFSENYFSKEEGYRKGNIIWQTFLKHGGVAFAGDDSLKVLRNILTGTSLKEFPPESRDILGAILFDKNRGDYIQEIAVSLLAILSRLETLLEGEFPKDLISATIYIVAKACGELLVESGKQKTKDMRFILELCNQAIGHKDKEKIGFDVFGDDPLQPIGIIKQSLGNLLPCHVQKSKHESICYNFITPQEWSELQIRSMPNVSLASPGSAPSLAFFGPDSQSGAGGGTLSVPANNDYFSHVLASMAEESPDELVKLLESITNEAFGNSGEAKCSDETPYEESGDCFVVRCNESEFRFPASDVNKISESEIPGVPSGVPKERKTARILSLLTIIEANPDIFEAALDNMSNCFS